MVLDWGRDAELGVVLRKGLQGRFNAGDSNARGWGKKQWVGERTLHWMEGGGGNRPTSSPFALLNP